MAEVESPGRAPGFHVMAKPTGPICNLDCRYCFYLEKERFFPDTPRWAMSPAVLETFIRDYITSQDAPVVNFTWQGGEPTLLGVDFFRTAIELQRRYAGGRRVENGLQTNALLLDDAWGELLGQEGFLVGVSIDGPRDLHDRYRVDRGGHPTFDRVMRGIDVLKKHRVEFNTLTVVHRQSAAEALEVYRFLRDVGSGFMQFIPVVERIGPGAGAVALALPGSSGEGPVTTWSVEPRQWGRFLCAVFDEWVRTDVGRVFVQLFDVMLESAVGGQASLCVFRETCGRALVVEHNGELYSCDHYVFPAFRLGNVCETPLGVMVASTLQRAFGDAKRDKLPAWCRQCDVLAYCHGECPKNRFARAPDGEAGLSYLCTGYRDFFHHVDPFMRFMAEELRHQRPPANVMRWVRERDERIAAAHAGRNAPCPCGSGRKFKRCCGQN